MNINNFASFSLNLISDFRDIWQYQFMRNAFEAGTIIAIVAALVGYFVIIRRLSFAGHALSHIGFAGAAGAALINVNPLAGLLTFTISGGFFMALLGKKAASRDVQIGIVLAFMLGLGILFINLYKGYATEAYSLLFGQVLGISLSSVRITLYVSLFILVVLAIFYRKLLFTTLDEEVAEAKGVSLFRLNLIIMLLIAVAVSVSVQIVGVLLIFSLLITPPAIAQRITRTPFKGMVVAAAIGLLVTWLGLFIGFYSPYPVSFFITSIAFITYILVRLYQKIF